MAPPKSPQAEPAQGAKPAPEAKPKRAWSEKQLAQQVRFKKLGAEQAKLNHEMAMKRRSGGAESAPKETHTPATIKTTSRKTPAVADLAAKLRPREWFDHILPDKHGAGFMGLFPRSKG